jgi:acetyl-CoA acyltransferase
MKSHQNAVTATEAGYFDAEIAPFELLNKKPDLTTGNIITHANTVAHDEGPRAELSIEKMAKLRSPFVVKSAVTAGTTSQMSDGAGVVLVVSEKALKHYGLIPMAKFRSFAVKGVPAEVMGIGPIKAIPAALEKANLHIDDIDWFELNEAFAAQSLAVIKEQGLDPTKINPQGGAIALGHPLGATGAIRVATLIHGLKRTKQRFGMVTMCIGTGMGAAGVIEAL